MKQPIKIKSEDGYTFYRLPDGRYADSSDENKVDMSWSSFEEIVATFHNEEIGYCVYFSDTPP